MKSKNRVECFARASLFHCKSDQISKQKITFLIDNSADAIHGDVLDMTKKKIQDYFGQLLLPRVYIPTHIMAQAPKARKNEGSIE